MLLNISIYIFILDQTTLLNMWPSSLLLMKTFCLEIGDSGLVKRELVGSSLGSVSSEDHYHGNEARWSVREREGQDVSLTTPSSLLTSPGQSVAQETVLLSPE